LSELTLDIGLEHCKNCRELPQVQMEPLMFDALWPEQNPTDRPLPEPTVAFRTADDSGPFTEEQVRGILTNPVYAGVGASSPIVGDAQWVRACTKLIEEDGPEQFLVNLLYVLRKSFE
jgi:hypothetical protein